MTECSNCGEKKNPAEAKFCSKCGTALSAVQVASSIETIFSNKCKILAELWLSYRDDVDFADFVDYNDLGLPLAYILENSIAVGNDESMKFIDESFDLLFKHLGIQDRGFEEFDELLSAAE
jgi:hypothetical protein